MTALSTASSSIVHVRICGRRIASGIAAGLGVVMFASAGCAKPATTSPEEVRLKIGVGTPTPGRGSGMRVLTGLLFAESLLTFGWDGRAVPNLAEKWEWQDEGRTLRVHLRPNLKLHDGRPVTAQFAADILSRRVAADTAQPTYVGGLEHVKKIISPDDRTIEIHLSRADNFLLSALDDLFIIDEEAGVGTGPFRITSRQPHLVAEKYAEYHRGTPGIDRVELLLYETQRAAMSAMMRGEVNMVQEVARESVEFLEGASRIQTFSSLRHFYIPLVFNLRHPILGRVEVRRALVQAIDRQKIVSEGMGGRGRVAEDPIWPLHWAYSASARRHSYSPEAAKLQLDVLGLPVRTVAPGSGQMASRFRITCLYWAADPEFERIALLLQRQLAAVGVDLVLDPARDMNDLQKRILAGDFEVHLFQLLGGRSFDWTYRFWHSPLGNQAALQDTGYSGADKILERLRAVNSDDETRAAVAELQQRFYEDVPAAFIAWIETTRAIDESFNVGKENDPDIFANLWRWEPATRRADQ